MTPERPGIPSARPQNPSKPLKTRLTARAILPKLRRTSEEPGAHRARGVGVLRNQLTAGSRDGAETAAGAQTVKLIVARDQQGLYDYFRWGFAGTPNIQVILDRRLWIRRERVQDAQAREAQAKEAQAVAQQRRASDRRRQPGMRGELLARGFVIAH